MDDITEKTLSNLVEQQFPEFYETEGPTFIEFAKTYYKWMEGEQEVSVPFTKGRVSFQAGNTTVTGFNTFFVDQFDPGDKIGLFYDDTNENYQIFVVDTVESDVSLTIANTVPLAYSSNSSLYGIVKTEQNPNYHIRRLNEYSDVDQTIEDFIVYFKEKYLKNIQFTTKTNTRQLIKHSLDLYRSKGTPQGLSLLFRLVFGVNVKVYYPGTDLFKLSDGQWFVPRYLELSLREDTVKFVNKQIVGLTSGATAFVESVIRRVVKGKFIDIAYISSINGTFLTNEFINTSVNPIALEKCPAIIGSLGSVDISRTGTGFGYEIGDVVDVYSDNGEQAKARVANVSNITGIIDFELINGGYGYTANSELLISEKILQVNNVVIDTATENADLAFETFETVSQPLANIAYVNGSAEFEANTPLLFYYANGSASGNGYLLSTNVVNSSVGTLLVAIYSGNLNVGYVGTTGNAITANIGTYTDVTATGNVIGHYANAVLKVSGASSSDFANGVVVYQTNTITLEDSANGTISRYVAEFGPNAYVTVVNTFGAFDLTKNLMVKTNPAINCNVLSVSMGVGVINVNNAFYDYYGNRIIAARSNTVANVHAVSRGQGAAFSLSNSFNYTEDILLNDDTLADYANVALNATAYGFPASPTANLSSVMDSALNYATYTFGKLTAIVGSAPGSDYNFAPIARIYEPLVYHFLEKDVKLTITGASGFFKIGEVVTQSGVSSRGLVVSSNSSCVQAELLRVLPDNQFTATVNATTVLTGTDSGVTANVLSVGENDLSEYIGINADIFAETVSANGAVTALDVIDAGFGFANGEIVNFFNANNTTVGQGHAVVNKVGKSTGFYKQKGGFLSDTKYLFDGLYYQDYSYEIRSSITLQKYEDMLKQIMHIPGTKYFGAFVYDTINNSEISSKATTVTQS